MTQQRRVIRTVSAPTRAEAEDAAEPIRQAFWAARWTEQEAIWIPGDRRVGLGESLLIDAEDQNLLEANGTLRIAFITDDPDAPEPTPAPAAREPDAWEQIGGVRYRRLVPRYAIGIVVFVIGAIVIASMWANRPKTPGFGYPDTPPTIYGHDAAADGTCEDGTYREVMPDGTVVCWDAPPPVFEGTPGP